MPVVVEQTEMVELRVDEERRAAKERETDAEGDRVKV